MGSELQSILEITLVGVDCSVSRRRIRRLHDSGDRTGASQIADQIQIVAVGIGQFERKRGKQKRESTPYLISMSRWRLSLFFAGIAGIFRR